jgi:hypothetical protein
LKVFQHRFARPLAWTNNDGNDAQSHFVPAL